LKRPAAQQTGQEVDIILVIGGPLKQAPLMQTIVPGFRTLRVSDASVGEEKARLTAMKSR
jgi:hypothetical protein